MRAARLTAALMLLAQATWATGSQARPAALSPPPTTSESAAEPDAAQPETTEPHATEPHATEPTIGPPEQAEPNTAVPNTTEPNKADPNKTGPNKTEPNTTGPNIDAPETAVPNTAESTTTKPKAAEPQMARPDGASGGQAEVDVVFHSPGCFTGGSTHMGMVSQLDGELDDDSRRVGGALTFGVLERDGVFLLPEPFSDWTGPARLLAAKTPLKAAIVDEEVTVLRNNREALFQRRSDHQPDYVARVYAGEREDRPHEHIERKTMTMWRLTAAKEDPATNASPATNTGQRNNEGPAAADARALPPSMLALMPSSMPPDIDALERDPLRWLQLPSYEVHIESPDGRATLVAMGLRHGTPGRLKAELDRARGEATGEPIMIHPGGGPAIAIDGHKELCGRTLAGLGYDAMGLRADELRFAPDALKAWAATHELPFIATNVRDAATHKAPFPRFRLFKRHGLDVLVLSAVGRDQLAGLSASARDRWELLPILSAINDAHRAAQLRLGKEPDLVVLIAAARRDERAQAQTAVGVDLVLGPYDRWNDHVSRRVQVDVLDERGGREGQPLSVPALVAASGPYNIGRVRAQFTRSAPADADAYWRLAKLVHRDTPAVHEGPRDEVFALEREALLRRYIIAGERTLLPDLERFLDDEIRGMVFGERVLSHLAYRDRQAKHAPQFSDALWMRLVANIMREELDADAAIVVNLPRGDTVTGPLPAAVLRTWLPTTTSVQRVDLSGAQLAALADAVRQHNSADPDPTEVVFSAGIDLNGKRIGGRRIDPRDHYTIAITDTLRRVPAAKAILSGADTERALVFEGDRVTSGDGDERLAVRGLVLHALERNVDPTSGAYAERGDATVTRWLHDDVETLQRQVRLSIEDLSLNGSAYRNTNNIGLFAASRETRTTTPNLFQLGLSGRLQAQYDGPWLAAEAGATGQLTSILLDIPGANLPPQEQRDDWLAWTEGRLNLLRLSLLGDSFRLVPFVRSAVDSEFTPTPRNNNDADAGFYPHQILLQQSAGVVLYLAPWLKELRVGLLVQEDLSELSTGAFELASVHLDVGVQASYRLTWPLWLVVLDSQLDLRYLAPDFDDRATDLSLRLQAVNKLVVPLGDWLSVYLFLDVFSVSGKLDSNRQFGASAVAGAGLSVSHLLTFDPLSLF